MMTGGVTGSAGRRSLPAVPAAGGREPMTEAERIRFAERYLSGYRAAYRMLKAGIPGGYGYDARDTYDAYTRYGCGAARGLSCADAARSSDDDRIWEDEVRSIRATVLSVAEPDEKLFLFQHYIRGNTVETCAEILDISVRTAYRLKKRALLTVSAMLGA